jgi:N-acetylmuramoyl-L-alanine amidase
MRAINKIILHCSATTEGRRTTVEDIRNWHKQRGFNDIGYHYVVYLDGSIHNGRDVELVGAHTKGHNTGSIGFVMLAE